MVKFLSKVRNREAFCCALLAQLISPYLNCVGPSQYGQATITTYTWMSWARGLQILE